MMPKAADMSSNVKAVSSPLSILTMIGFFSKILEAKLKMDTSCNFSVRFFERDTSLHWWLREIRELVYQE